MAIRQNNAEQVSIEKGEAEAFAPRGWELEPENPPTEGERDATLIVSKISFKESSTWSFFEQGGIILAKIADGDFWRRVHNHEIKFGEGDSLKVRLHWKVEAKDGKLKQSNKIIRVYRVYERPKQMRLDGDTEEEGRPPRLSRRIRFEDE